MRLIPRVLVVLAVFVVVIIDLTEYWFGTSGAALRFSVFESFIDILLITFTYLVLAQEIKSRRQSQERLTETLEKLNFVNSELIQANALKTKLMNMAAHDLRNPIGAVLGYSQLLQQSEHMSGDERHMLARIESQSNQTLGLINDLLDVSALERQGLQLKPSVFEFTTLVEEAIEDFARAAEIKQQKIVVLIRQKALISGDWDRLKQVLVNLIGNAVKYSPIGTTIEISLLRNEKSVLFKVKDRGPGLSLSELDQVFEVFSKVKKMPTAGESSTGLGLSIVKALVGLHGGKVWVESEGPGKGSSFMVELPLEQ